MAQPVNILGLSCRYAGGEALSCKVGDPITELIVKRSDEASLFSVQGVTDREGRPTSITIGWQVRWLITIAKEEEIPPLLCP